MEISLLGACAPYPMGINPPLITTMVCKNVRVWYIPLTAFKNFH